MKNKPDLKHVMFIFGIIALIVGAFDPLEGSIIIVIGIISLSWSAYLNHDRHWRVFLAACAMIIVGVIFLFYLSSLGGFGGNSGLSWWWGILIMPYPIGWIIAMTTLTIRAIKTVKRIRQDI